MGAARRLSGIARLRSRGAGGHRGHRKTGRGATTAPPASVAAWSPDPRAAAPAPRRLSILATEGTATADASARPRTMWRVGVDSGGTFTDICLLDESSGSVCVWKVPSTPDDPSLAIAGAVTEG